MWNAYKTVNASLPKRDVRINDLQVDGSLVISGDINEYDSLDVTFTHEDNATSAGQIEVLKVGDIIYLYLPTITKTLGGAISNNYKSFPLPAEYRPVSVQYSCVNGQSGSGPTYSSGSAIIQSGGTVLLYVNSARSAPATGQISTVFPCVLVYSKSL